MTSRNVPRLRFKGFGDEWKSERLSEMTSILHGLTYKPSDTVNGQTLVLRSSNIKHEKLVFNDNVYVKHDVVNVKNVQQGDIVMVVRNGSRSLIGKHALVSKNMPNTVIGAFMSLLRSKNGQFLNYLLSTDDFHHEVYKSLGATINQITKKDFNLMKFKIPFPPEQQRIGKFFSKLDYLINRHSQKLEQLKKLKRGYLQKMFPQKGETVPCLRFSGFSGDWQEESLDKLVSIRTGNRNAEDDVPDGKYVFFDRSSEIKHLNGYDFDGKVIVYPGEGANFLPRKYEGKYSLHQRAYGLYDFRNINSEYLYQYLLTQNHTFLKYAVGTTSKSLRVICFKKVIVPCPSLEEQQRIADFFSRIDNFINSTDEKIQDLRQQKKAYLQKMFI